MIRVGVIGYGYWGPNLARNFAEAEGARLVRLSDLNPDRVARARLRHPAAEVTLDPAEVLGDPAVDAIAIATPLTSHFPLALGALEAGKHVLVEKPLAASSDEARRLIEEAERRRLVLMVGHTFVYNGAVRKIVEIAGSGEIGELYYYDSVRVNLGLFQRDVNVLWDLAVHDLSIMEQVLRAPPRAVATHGMSHLPGWPENMAYLTLFFDGTMIAHIHVNWLAPVKVRRALIGGSLKMIVYDALEPSETVKVYDWGVKQASDVEGIHQVLYDYRLGGMTAPRWDTTEPLKIEVAHFLDCAAHGKRPLTDGIAGLRLIRILEAATRSMADRGRPIPLDGESTA